MVAVTDLSVIYLAAQRAWKVRSIGATELGGRSAQTRNSTH